MKNFFNVILRFFLCLVFFWQIIFVQKTSAQVHVDGYYKKNGNETNLKFNPLAASIIIAQKPVLN